MWLGPTEGGLVAEDTSLGANPPAHWSLCLARVCVQGCAGEPARLSSQSPRLRLLPPPPGRLRGRSEVPRPGSLPLCSSRA